MLNWNEAVEKFRTEDSIELASPVLESEELRNAILGWQSITPLCDMDKSQPYIQTDLSNNEKWALIWNCVHFDYNEFATAAGVNASDVESVFLRLRALRLIYPDGTVSKMAKQLISFRMKAAIAELSKKSKTAE